MDQIVNHEEAEQYAAMHREDSNLARCYLDMKLQINELRDELAEESGLAQRLGQKVMAAERLLGEERKRCANIASAFTIKPDRSIHPDIPWDKMSEQAQMVAHTTAQQIAYAIREHTEIRKCAHQGPAELLCEREEGHDGPHRGDCSKAYPKKDSGTNLSESAEES